MLLISSLMRADGIGDLINIYNVKLTHPADGIGYNATTGDLINVTAIHCIQPSPEIDLPS